MANGRNKIGRGGSGRDGGGFVAIPWVVMDCPAYGLLSHPARTLLMEIARQYAGKNNGRLLASAAYLTKRGWHSNDVITRAKRELLKAKFIYQTVMGHRPNKASWYALTWQKLDKIDGYDDEALRSPFEFGAYRAGVQVTLKVKPSRDELCQRWLSTPINDATLKPSRGTRSATIAPSNGVVPQIIAPCHGAIGVGLRERPTPLHGDHIEIPSAGASSSTARSYIHSYCSSLRVKQLSFIAPNSFERH